MNYHTEMPSNRGSVKSGNVTLLEHWTVKGRLDNGRVFVISIKPGFEFDGASIPRWLWRVCGHPMECPRLAAALAHDWLYRSHVCKREVADLIYRAICKNLGIHPVAYNTEYRVLRIFGRSAWNGWSLDDQTAARKMGRLCWR